MKRLFFLLFLLLPSLLIAQSQSLGNLNILSENGENFYLFLDGKKQNVVARSNIRISGVPDLYYSVKIVFADSSIASITKNHLYVSDGDDIMRDAYYRIRREKAGKAKLVFYSMLNVDQDFVAGKGVYVLKFGEPDVSETMAVAEKQDVVIPPATAVTVNHTGSLNIFSQNADKFFLYLDGVKQNEVAQSNVRINDIPGRHYNVKIVFENKKFWPIVKNNVFIADEDEIMRDASYRIRRDKSGYPRLKFYSMTEVNENFVAPAGMHMYSFGKPAPVTTNGDIAVSKKMDTPANGTVTGINVTATPAAPAKKATAKTGTPKSKPAGKTAAAATVKENEKPVATAGKPLESTTAAAPEIKKCNGWPMGKADLALAKKTIGEAGKDDEKLTAAKGIIASNCLLASQVAEFCSLFASEKSKLAFAKYAYKFTIDRKNYAEVNKALSQETSKKELNTFINGG